MSRRHSTRAWEDAVVWHTVNAQADGVQQLSNEVFEQRRAINQEKSERQQDTASLRAELDRLKQEFELLKRFFGLEVEESEKTKDD